MEELHNLLRIQKSELQVLEWLGAGGTSAVFKGVWHHDGEVLDVAIKKMALNAREASDLSRAIRTMLNHSFENVRKFYGGCVTDDGTQLWLVMEYANGGDLHNYLRRYESPLSEVFQLSLFVQATKALAALHNNAPSPILLTNINSNNFLVHNSSILLTDFGISKPRLSGAENNIDKIRWMAPEVVSTNNGHSTKSDIFSLGMVFYEIITHQVPYHDKNMPQILDKIKRRVLPKLPADCPKEWEKLLHCCWSYKPKKRPNVNELLVMWETIEKKQLMQSVQMPPPSTISAPHPKITRSLSMNAADGGEKSRTKGFFSSIRKASSKVLGRKKDNRRETDVMREVPVLHASA